MAITKNLKKEFEDVLRPFVEHLKLKSEIEGIVLLGGLGKRNHADIYSDIDLAIFVTHDLSSGKAPQWLPNFEFSVYPASQFHPGITKLGFNVHQQELPALSVEEWDQIKKDAFSKSVLIYDRTGKVEKFIKSNIKYSKVLERELLLKAVSKLPPYIKINPKKQGRRGLYLVAHHLLNQGIDLIVESLFALNRQFLPHDKWKVQESLSLEWLPAHYMHDLEEGLLIKKLSYRDIERREKALENIANQILKKIEERLGDSELNLYDQACKTILKRQLISESFADKLFKKIKSGRGKTLTNVELEKVFGFVNYHLITNMNEFCQIVDLAEIGVIEGLLECRKVLAFLKK